MAAKNSSSVAKLTMMKHKRHKNTMMSIYNRTASMENLEERFMLYLVMPFKSLAIQLNLSYFDRKTLG